jgi:hypothetical protein
MRKDLILLVSVLFAILLSPPIHAADTFRLVKDADSKDANNPATFAYQRSDGGKADYVTEGAIKVDMDFLKYNDLVVTPDVSWNHNTLSRSPTDNWNAGGDFRYRYMYNATADRYTTDRLELDLGVKQQQDLIKSTNSRPVKLDLTWYTHYLQTEPWNPNYNWTVRPTVSVFRSDVYSAPVDKETSVAPTGVLSGEIFTLDLARRWQRWSISASTKSEYVTHNVAGQVSGLHRLNTVALSYDFYDQSLTKEPGAPSQSWNTGITLRRQVGDDPLNALPHDGFTQLMFTIKY